MEDFETVAGTKLYVSDAAPAAQTAVAYGALTWVEVGELTSIGGVLGRSYSTASLSTVGNARDREKKGSYKLPNASFECAWVEDDEGQVIIMDGSNSNDILSFKLVKQSGALRYFTAQVMEFVENNGTSNDAVKGNMTLLRQDETIIA